jgi:PAS domain S-box-containing protein
MKRADPLHENLRAMNEALVLGALRQQELAEAAERLNDRLRAEIAKRELGEVKVRVSETRYRRLFEAAHDGILLVDPGTRKIIDANPLMTQLLGYSRRQLIGKELFEIGLLKDRGASRAVFRKLRVSREIRYEDLPLERRDGRHREVEVVACLYEEGEEGGGPVIQYNIRDISERRRQEAAQRRVAVLTASNRKLEREISRRVKTEKLLREAQSRLKRVHSQLRRIAHKAIHAQEEERLRISHDLHDQVIQVLLGINVHVAVLSKVRGRSSPAFDRQMTHIQRLVQQSVEAVYNYARELRPAHLDDLGFIPAIKTYLKKFMADTGIRSDLTVFAGLDKLNLTQLTVLYRITQEALTNVARHAKADAVQIRIQRLRDRVKMTIKDNGGGFDVLAYTQGKKSQRLGVAGMRERMEMIGGTFDIRSAKGRGTTITAEVPVTG